MEVVIKPNRNIDRTKTPSRPGNYKGGYTAEIQPATPPQKPNPLFVAFMWLGNRLKDHGDHYRLDNVPRNLDYIIQEANRAIKSCGGKQIEGKDCWLV